MKVGARRYESFGAIQINHSVDDLAASFSVAVLDDLALEPSTEISLSYGNIPLGCFRVDIETETEEHDRRTIQWQGRSLTRELIDATYSCSWSAMAIAEIAKKLCGIFKVPLRVDGGAGRVPHFAMQSESPANALINATRALNMMCYAAADGGLVLTLPAQNAPVATLKQGEHFTGYRFTQDFRQRFSHYEVRATAYESGGSALKSTERDFGVEHFRPHHIVADRFSESLGATSRRALLERNRRLARSKLLEITLPSWGPSADQLFEINTLVRVVIPRRQLDSVLLVAERALVLDPVKGASCRLKLLHSEAFAGLEPVKHHRGSGAKK